MNGLMEAEEKLGGMREVGSQGGRAAAVRPPGGQLGGREDGEGSRQRRGLREAAWERGTALEHTRRRVRPREEGVGPGRSDRQREGGSLGAPLLPGLAVPWCGARLCRAKIYGVAEPATSPVSVRPGRCHVTPSAVPTCMARQRGLAAPWQ